MTEQQTAMRQALREATQIATWLWQNFYKDTAPQWEVLPDICGVLSQIDNMVAGLKYSADEPVAWMWKDGTITSDPDRADGTWTPLYTRPQPAIPLPPEAQTEAEKTAYAFGWWKAMETVREQQPADQAMTIALLRTELQDARTEAVALRVNEQNLIAALEAEREACAKVCDELELANLYGVKECAAAIRARSKT